jgi:hypothetical protein
MRTTIYSIAGPLSGTSIGNIQDLNHEVFPYTDVTPAPHLGIGFQFTNGDSTSAFIGPVDLSAL